MFRSEQKDFVKANLKFLSLVLIEGLAAAAWLLLIPKEAGNADFLGYSFRRLALLTPILALTGLALLGRLLLKNKESWQVIITDEKRRVKMIRIGILLGFLMAFLSWSFAFFFHFLRIFDDVRAFIRLLPMIIYFFMAGLEILLFIILFWQNDNKHKASLKLKMVLGRAFWVALGVMFAGWLIVELTGLGKDPEFVSINSLNIPLLEGQVWYVAGLLVLILLLTNAWAGLPEKIRCSWKVSPDLLVCLALWTLALVLWMSLPLPRNNYFAPQTLPPNYQTYPFSDAEQYDMNSIWVWKGAIKDTVISKPFYVVFLSILHALVGLDYGKVILLQTLVLALLPVIMYLIGKEMHSRLGGLALAVFCILREMNSIQAVNFSNVSNSKLLLSDTLATLLVAILLLLIIRWFKSPRDSVGKYPFLIGGIIACLNLTRIQTLLLEPLLLVLIVFRYGKQYKKLLQAFGLAMLALAMVLVPVLARNHSITGVYWLDNPSSSSALYSFFVDEDDTYLDIPEVETQEDILKRNVSVIYQVFSQNFGRVILSIFDNFLHNILSTFLIFPVRLGNQIDFFSYLRIEDPFWSEVYSLSNFWNFAVVLFNIIIIAIGIGSVTKKHLAATLLLVGFYGAYNLSSAVVRLSGWRFIQPVDWLAIAFFAFGLIELLRAAISRLIGQNGIGQADPLIQYQPQIQKRAISWKSLLAFGLVFLLIGAFIPLRELLFPAAYPDYTREEVCTAFQDALTGSQWERQSGEIQDFCLREDVLAYKGVGIFPRYFKADSGFYKRTYDPFFGEQEYGRLVFRTVGEPNTKVYIKTEDDSIKFPDGVEVYVIGENEKKFEARAVLILDEEEQLIVSWPEEIEAE